MAISCLSEDLLSEARCLDSCVPRGMQTAVLISLFCQMAQVSCDSADLIDNARCISECVPDHMQGAVLIYLACQIVNNGGGGGGGAQQVFCGNYDGEMPTTPIPDASVTCAINYDKDAPYKMWKWSGTDWSG